MAWPFLYFAGDTLTIAELSAARLDGHLVELGEGYIPADAVETAVMRAASLRPLLGDTLAAVELSAAWIHGALGEPPARHTVRRATPQRLHHVISRRLRYHDARIDPDDVIRCGGVRVTTPARTLADLARRADPPSRAAALAMLRGCAQAGDAIEWLDRHRSLPHRRTALVLLDELARRAESPDQDDVTR